MAVKEFLRSVLDPEGAKREKRDAERREKAEKKKVEMDAKRAAAAEKKRATMEAAREKAEAKKTTKAGTDATKQIRADALRYEKEIARQEREAEKRAEKAERDAERAANKAADKAERAAERAAEKEAARVAKGEQAVAKYDDATRMEGVKKAEAELKKLDEFLQGSAPQGGMPPPASPAPPAGRPPGTASGKGKAREEAAYKRETNRLVLGGIGSNGRGSLDWLAEHGPQAPELRQAERDREERERRQRKADLEKEIEAGKRAHREFLRGSAGKNPVAKPAKYHADQRPGDVYEKDFVTGESGYRQPLASERDEWSQL